jgi:hypothetical protein
MLIASTAMAGELTPTTKAEIDGLLTTLGASSCESYRNGSWYKGPAAQAHLTRKYEYLLKKDKVGTAEDFIERAGSKSSFSGEAYMVRCPGQAPEPSATWLSGQLSRLRKKADPEAHPAK